MIHKSRCAGIRLVSALSLAVIFGLGCDRASRTEVDAQIQALDARQEQMRAEVKSMQENLQQLEAILEGVAALREENQQVHAQIAGLRQDFDQFSERFQTSVVQRLPASTGPIPTRTVSRATPPPTPAVAIEEDTEIPVAYWLSLPAGVRHNQGCAFFKRTRGKLGSATEGVPCLRCGG